MNKKLLRMVIYAAMAVVLILKLGVIRKLFELSLWPDMTFYTNLGLQPGKCVFLNIDGYYEPMRAMLDLAQL